MTPKERMLAALNFSQPDKIPVYYNPSAAGLSVHGQKLLDLFNEYPPDNPINITSLPQPAPETLSPEGEYHEFKTDIWGIEWESLIFGIHGHPHRYPFANWEEAEDFVFPPVPTVPEPAENNGEYLVFEGWVSIFERLHALRPFEEVLVDFFTEDPALIRFLDRVVDYWEKVIAVYLEAKVGVIRFGDDWGMQTAPLVPPELFRKLFKPRYEKLMRPIRESGTKILFHCCGLTDAIGLDLLDLEIDIFWPQIKLYENDSELVKRSREKQVTILLHPDRQHLIPEGTPEQIEAAIRRYAETYHELGGGGIFYIEIENDAPWENVKALIEAVDRYR